MSLDIITAFSSTPPPSHKAKRKAALISSKREAPSGTVILNDI